MPLKYRSEYIYQHHSTRLVKPQINKDQKRLNSHLILFASLATHPHQPRLGLWVIHLTNKYNNYFFIFVYSSTHLSCDAKLFPPCFLLHILAKDGPCPKLGVIILGIYHSEK